MSQAIDYSDFGTGIIRTPEDVEALKDLLDELYLVIEFDKPANDGPRSSTQFRFVGNLYPGRLGHGYEQIPASNVANLLAGLMSIIGVGAKSIDINWANNGEGALEVLCSFPHASDIFGALSTWFSPTGQPITKRGGIVG